ncbi:hypothetical protein ACFL23_04435 [Patescibacteria group bacterium]
MKKLALLLLSTVVIFFAISVINCHAEIKFILSEEIASACITMSGSKTGKGHVTQTLLYFDINSWYILGWHNYNLQLSDETERDLFFGKWFEVNNFIIDFRYKNCVIEGERIHELDGILKYGKIVSLILSKPCADGLTLDDNRFYIEIAYPFIFGNLTYQPIASTAFLNNFYTESGFAHITGGASGEYEFTKNISATGYLKYQHGLMDTKKSQLYGGGGMKVNY